MRSAVPLLLFLSLPLGACARGDGGAHRAPIRVTDSTGHVVHLDAPAGRVVALIPAATEMVLRIAGADRLVARTDYDTEPALDTLPSVGGGLTPSIEWLVARRPDLVVAWPDNGTRDVVRSLEAAGVAVYGARMETLADVRRTVRDLGTLLGARPRADTLVGALDARLDAVRAAVAGRPRRTVAYVESHEPPLVVGSGTYLDELIDIAGGRNVFSDADAPWPQVALEAVVRRQPDVLILPSMSPAHPDTAWLRSAPGWRDLRAVRAGDVHVVDENTFSRPGLGLGDVAATLAGLIHPEARVP